MSSSLRKWGRWRRLGLEVAIFALFVALTFVYLHPLPEHLRTDTADMGWDDPYINTHFMRVFQDWLLGLRPGHRALDADFFFPHPLGLTTNDACLGMAVMLLPLRAFTDDYLFMINVGLFVSFPLSAHAVYLFVRDATSNVHWRFGAGLFGTQVSTNGQRPSDPYLRRGAGIVAGLLFGFSAYRFHQLDHPGLEQMQWVPYLAWALLRTSQRPSMRWLLVLVPSLFFALFASSNLAIYSLPAFLIFGIFFLTVSQNPKQFLCVVALAAAIVAVPLVPIYAQLFEGIHAYAIRRDLGEIQSYSATPEQFFAVPRFLALWGPRFGPLLGGESATFLTVTALASVPFAFLAGKGNRLRRAVQALLIPLCIVGVGVFGVLAPLLAVALAVPALAFGAFAFANRRGEATLFLSWMLVGLAVTYAVFAVGPHVSWNGTTYVGPWMALMRVPGFASVRTPSRFWFIVTFAIASVAGIGIVNLTRFLAPLLRRTVPRNLAFSALVLSAIGTAFGETRPREIPLRRMIARSEIPAVYQWLRDAAPPGAVLELPRYDARRERSRLYFTNFHKRPGVGGESGVLLPRAAGFFNEVIGDGDLRQKVQEVWEAGVRIVIIDGRAWQADHEALMRTVLLSMGATRGPTFDGVKTYLLPEPPSAPRNFSWTDPAVQVRVRFDAAPTNRVSLHVANSGSETLYGKGTFEARLEGTVRSATSKLRSFDVALVMSPPLIAPYSAQRVEAHLPPHFGDFKDGNDIIYTLRLGDGPPSTPVHLRMTAAPPGWEDGARCRLTRIASGVTAGNVVRQLFEAQFDQATNDRVWISTRPLSNGPPPQKKAVPPGAIGSEFLTVESPTGGPLDEPFLIADEAGADDGAPSFRCSP